MCFLKKYLFLWGIYLLLLYGSGCKDALIIKQDKPIKLKLNIQSDQLSVSFFNASSKKINIWSPDEFRGWETISFRLKTKSSPEVRRMKRKERDWTGTGELLFEIPPGGSRNFQLNMKDGWWRTEENISGYKDQPILV